jgi:hypothetical protein
MPPVLQEKRQTFRTACLAQITNTQAEDLSNLYSDRPFETTPHKKVQAPFPLYLAV